MNYKLKKRGPSRPLVGRRCRAAVIAFASAFIFNFSFLIHNFPCAAQALPFAFWKSSGVTNPVAGYAFWWNPDLGVATNAPTNGAPVVTWTDQGGSHLVLSAGERGPQVVARNGHAVLQFSDEGAGNYMANTAESLSSPWELVAVVMTGPDVLDGNPFCIEADSGQARGVFVSESAWEISWNNLSYGGSPAASAWYVIDCVFSATGTSALWINGVANITQTAESAMVTGIEIGGFGSTYPWNGAIGDVIIYTTPLTPAQQSQNVTTLRNKYGF